MQSVSKNMWRALHRTTLNARKRRKRLPTDSLLWIRLKSNYNINYNDDKCSNPRSACNMHVVLRQRVEGGRYWPEVWQQTGTEVSLLFIIKLPDLSVFSLLTGNGRQHCFLNVKKHNGCSQWYLLGPWRWKNRNLRLLSKCKVSCITE